MSLLIDSTTKDLKPWVESLRKAMPSEQVVIWDEHPDLSQVTTAVVWNHRKGLFAHLPNLKLVSSLGAGVDRILNDESLPSDVQISRIVSKELSNPMSNFCIGAVLYFQRQFDKYARDKQSKTWHQEFNPEKEMKVGILGLGELGQDLATKLTYLGFSVSGLSQTRKKLDRIESYEMNELDIFLKGINILIVMLPATPQTRGILSMSLFEKMNPGSFLINVARGQHQIEADIIKALDTGLLAGAFLDVFQEEPLPSDSALWDHPNVFITPHIAVVTKIEAAIPLIVENHQRILNGQVPVGVVNRTKGY